MLTERATCWTRRCRHSQERGNGPPERTFQPRHCRPPPPCDILSLLVSLQKFSWVLRVLLLDKGVTSSAHDLELVCCRVGLTDFYLKRFALQFYAHWWALIRMKHLEKTHSVSGLCGYSYMRKTAYMISVVEVKQDIRVLGVQRLECFDSAIQLCNLLQFGSFTKNEINRNYCTKYKKISNTEYL